MSLSTTEAPGVAPDGKRSGKKHGDFGNLCYTTRKDMTGGSAMEKKNRMPELDYVRVLAMLGVVTIHVTGAFVYQDSAHTLAGMNLAFLLNQIVRFAVPMFMVLSGASLGFGEKKSCGRFWKARFFKLLPPYLIWSLLHWGFYHRLQSWEGLGSALLWGTASAHLYFIIITLQFYLLYPVLRTLTDRWPLQTLLGTLGLSLVCQQYIFYAGTGFLPGGLPLWELLPTWVGYFVFGMVLHTWDLPRLCRWCGRSLPFLAPLTVLAAVLYAYESKLTGSLDSIKWQLFFYVPLLLLLFLGLGSRLKGREGADRAVSFLAQRSQTIFFCHVLLLECLRKLPVFNGGTRAMLLTFLVLLPASTLVAWGIDSVTAAVKKRR